MNIVEQGLRIFKELLSDDVFPKLIVEVDKARAKPIVKDFPDFSSARAKQRIQQDLFGDTKSALEKLIAPLTQRMEFPHSITATDVAEVILLHISGHSVEHLKVDKDLRERIATYLQYQTRINRVAGIELPADKKFQLPFLDDRQKIEGRILATQKFSVFMKPHTPEDNHVELVKAALCEVADVDGEVVNLAKTWVELDRRFVDEGQFYRPIWKSSHGPEVYLLPREENSELDEQVYRELPTDVTLLGNFSNSALPAAMDAMRKTFLPILSVTSQSALIEEVRIDSISQPIGDLGSIHIGEEEPKDKRKMKLADFTEISLGFLFSRDGQTMINGLMEIMTNHHRNPATLEKRIANAVNLLTIEPDVDSDGIAMALSTAAVESLLVEDGDTPTKCVKNYSSALLTKNPTLRKTASTQLGKLYDWRSEVLHGRGIECPFNVRVQARRLACGVLRGLMSFRNHMSMIGKQLTFEDWVDELYISHRKGQALVAVANLHSFLPQDVPKCT